MYTYMRVLFSQGPSWIDLQAPCVLQVELAEFFNQTRHTPKHYCCFMFLPSMFLSSVYRIIDYMMYAPEIYVENDT